MQQCFQFCENWWGNVQQTELLAFVSAWAKFKKTELHLVCSSGSGFVLKLFVYWFTSLVFHLIDVVVLVLIIWNITSLLGFLKSPSLLISSSAGGFELDLWAGLLRRLLSVAGSIIAESTSGGFHALMSWVFLNVSFPWSLGIKNRCLVLVSLLELRKNYPFDNWFAKFERFCFLGQHHKKLLSFAHCLFEVINFKPDLFCLFIFGWTLY